MIQFDVTIIPQRLNDSAAIAQAVEACGAAGLWTSETAHNPFLALTHAAAATERIQLGTAIAVAFARSPMVTAQTAWDLAAQSNGRFILGLGTQVKAHITRRFGMPWSAPIPRLREYIEALRAIWQSFQTNAPLRYRGETYRLGLLTPFFNPGPIEHPHIPIYITGVNQGALRLAGELCQGCHVHSFHTEAYLREVVRPAITAGAEAAGRTIADVSLACAIFVVTGRTPAELSDSAAKARAQIAFYASTPAYRAVLQHHGWGDLQARLNDLARSGRWADMGDLISHDLLRAFAVVAPPDELPYAVRERYAGLLDRIGYYLPFTPGDPALDELWKHSARAFA